MTAWRRPAQSPAALLPAALLLATAAFGQSSPPVSDDPLFARTLPADIDTAGAAELRAWLRQLGLPDGGDRSALQQRVRDHYELPRADDARADDAPAAGAASAITVESARSARSRSDATGHTTLVLEGDVAVAAVDRDTGARHTIRADRITYHQERHSLTAAGSVVYTVVTEDGAEVFRGESLSVDTQRWEGIFYDGESRVDQQAEETELTYTYTGRAITRRDDDTVVLEQATVTSSEDPSDPRYRIEAERLWILAPEEWAVRNAFVHVGDVPVLYLPYFLRPGGRLVFHPAFGVRRRVGTYLQTTTYLIGGRRPAAESLSLMQRNAAADRYDDQRLGLFLVPAPASGRPADADDELTVMVDLYTRLGVFAGLRGRFGGLSLFGGIAASRALVESPPKSGYYTPYLTDERGEPVSHWDRTSILGLSVPLRYGLTLDVDARGDLGTLQGSFAFFSDPAFSADFLSRAHDLPTGGLLGLPQGPLTSPPRRDQLEWLLGGDLALHPLIGAPPALATLTLPTLSARWLWRSREEERPDESAADKLRAASPTRDFYYPDTLTFPAVTAVAAGSLYRWRADGGAFAADVGYSVRPVVSIDHRFDGQAETRDQVDLDLRYTRVDTGATARIIYSASAFDRLVGLDGALEEAGYYQVHTRHAYASAQDVTKQQKSDREKTTSLLQLNNTLTLRPLVSVPNLSGSNVSYGLEFRLHDVKLDPGTGDPAVRGPAWDRDGVGSHRAAAAAVLTGTDLRIDLGAGVDLPPRPLAADARLETDAGPFSMTLRGRMADPEMGAEAGTLQPVSIDGRGTLRIGSDASISQSFRLDERQRLERLSTEATAYGLTGTVRASERTPLDPSGDPLPDTPRSLRATELALGYRLDTGTLTYWKNRIRLNAGVQTRLAFDPEAYERDNSFTFDLRLGLQIFRFLELSFTSTSVNRHLYSYLPGAAARAGVRWVNPLVDLARSFNFLNDDDRTASRFKLESLRVAALHRLGDWNLTLAYQGRPEQHEGQEIRWTAALSIEVRWVPIPELYGSFHIDRDGIDIGDR